MKITVTEKLLDYEGKTISEQDGKPIIVRNVIFNALNSSVPGENLPTEKKQKCYEITSKAYKNKEIDLSPEDVTFLLERVGVVYNPLTVGRMRELLS